MADHEHAGFTFTPGSRAGSRYKCKCGWRTGLYRDEVEREAAFAAIEGHIASA